jgi:hypothetical protein
MRPARGPRGHAATLRWTLDGGRRWPVPNVPNVRWNAVPAPLACEFDRLGEAGSAPGS